MSSGIQTHRKSGVALSLGNSLTLQHKNPFTISHSANSSDGEADIAGASGGQPSGLPNVARFNSTASHQRIFSGHVLDNPEHFYDDAPYIPPRISHAELPTYPAPDPRVGSVYDPTNHNIQQHYPFEGGTSPSESHDSVESNWSTPSSTSSQQIVPGYDFDSTFQHAQTPRPPRVTHYPAYRGKQRLGFEHTHYGEQHTNTGVSYYRAQDYLVDDLFATETYDAGAQVGLPSQASYPSTSSQAYIPTLNRPPNISSVNDISPSVFSDTAAYLRLQLGLSSHESVSLRSLPDPLPGEKPSTPLPMLIKLAIYGSPNKQLTLQEIYTELENRFQWFRDHKHDRAWKNSIRHNLSLNKVFKHVPRPITEPGKGSYWRLDVSEGEGYKRTRKRRPKNRMVMSEEEEDGASEDDRPSPVDPSQASGPSRSSGTPVEDVNIDPGLRSEGHVVGEGRTRSTARRVGGSPYPQQSPRYQQGPLPVVVGQDIDAPGQSSIRFGQPAFNFPAYSQARSMPPPLSVPSASSFVSPSMMATATAQTTAGLQLQNVSTFHRTAHVSQPALGGYSGDPGDLSVARHMTANTEPREPSQRSAPRSSSGSSSGSSRTWHGARSGS